MEDQKPATKKEMKILILGDSYVGKTSLLRKFIKNKFNDKHSQSTCGLDTEVKLVQIQGQEVNLVIWDSAGYERNSKILPSSSFKRVQGVLLVYSVDDRESFERIQYWMSQVDETAPKNVIKILVASKIDSQNVKVPRKEGAKLAEMCGIQFLETSSKDGTGVCAPFYLIAEEFIEQIKSESTAATLNEKAILKNFDIENDDKKDSLQKSPRCCLS